MAVIINLECEQELVKDLKKYLGYKDEGENNDLERLFIECLNIKNKKMLNIKTINQVFISKELFQNSKYELFENVVYDVKREFENNNIQNIRKRLSKKVDIPYFKDYLLNNWDIYHLHLCKDMPKCKNRRDELLFVKIYNNNVYFLDIKEHNSFASRNFIEIIHNNWTEIIAEYKIENIIDIQPKVKNDKDIFELWTKGINVFIPIYDENLKKEIFYAPPSLGINIQGYRSQDIMKLISFRKECDNIKKYLNKYKEEIQFFISKQINIKFNVLKFAVKFNFNSNIFYLLEKNSRLKFGWNGTDITLIDEQNT